MNEVVGVKLRYKDRWLNVGGSPPAGGGNKPPTAVGALTVASVTASTVRLTWTAATDTDASVLRYEVRRGSSLLGSTTELTFTDSGLPAGTSYTYSVTAVDSQGLAGPASSVVGTTTVATAGFTAVLDEQFASLNAGRWNVYNNSTFGAPTRIQRYMSANVTAGAGASAGATGGTSLRLTSSETDAGSGTLPSNGDKGTRYSYTAGMLDTKGVGYYLPLYCRIEARMRIPHGQGLWPAFWLTSAAEGSTTIEVDTMEYFHTNTPGQILFTLHRKNNAGTYEKSVNKARGLYEEPNYTPRWVTIRQDIVPENGVPDAPTTNVLFKGYIDGTLIWSYRDTQASYWTDHTRIGGDPDKAYNLYIQGCQIDGDYVGHPRSPLGYQHWRNACSISGTAPNSCALTYQGHGPIIAPRFDGVANVFEIDYVKVWKYTG